MEGNPFTWNRKLKQEEVTPEELEEVHNRMVWTLWHGFYKPTPGRWGQILLLWPQGRCSYCEHEMKWYGIKKKILKPPPITKPTSGKQNQGNTGGPPKVRIKRVGSPYKQEKNAVLGMWPGWTFCHKLPWKKVLVL